MLALSLTHTHTHTRARASVFPLTLKLSKVQSRWSVQMISGNRRSVSYPGSEIKRGAPRSSFPAFMRWGIMIYPPPPLRPAQRLKKKKSFLNNTQSIQRDPQVSPTAAQLLSQQMSVFLFGLEAGDVDMQGPGVKIAACWGWHSRWGHCDWNSKTRPSLQLKGIDDRATKPAVQNWLTDSARAAWFILSFIGLSYLIVLPKGGRGCPMSLLHPHPHPLSGISGL